LVGRTLGLARVLSTRVGFRLIQAGVRVAFLVVTIAAWLWAGEGWAQPGTVLSEQKISDTAGGFGGLLGNFDLFGSSVVSLGDLNGDGVGDLAVGVVGDDDGGFGRGALWVLFLDPNGRVISEQKISDTTSGFGGVLDNFDQFGLSVASLGDLDGDGIGDLAVGAPGDGDGGQSRGAVWVLFLDPNGRVTSEQKISDTAGGFGGVLDNADTFGISVASLGDLDGDGVGDLAVGAMGDDDGGGFGRGAVWVLFLDPNGRVISEQKISDTAGGFGGVLDNADWFGFSVASLGDLDGDGVGDLAVGARQDDDGGFSRGALWILFLDPNGRVTSEQKISDTAGGFGGVLDDLDLFGSSVTSLGDLDGDGVGDLAVGAPGNDNDGSFDGAVWVLFLDPNGRVISEQKISDTAGGFGGVLDIDDDHFGVSVASLGDLDGDGVGDLAVGANQDDDGGGLRGAVWLLFLEGPDGLAQCLVELEDALEALEECRAELDEDRDGEPDQSDHCPGTPEHQEVDNAGCSLEQFCTLIDIKRGRDVLRCLRSDWRNDEPLRRRPRDCTVEWVGAGHGWSALECVVR